MSYSGTSDEVKSILIANNRLDLIQPINDDIVTSLINFIKPFNECSEILSGDSYPTINLIALYYHELRKELEIDMVYIATEYIQI